MAGLFSLRPWVRRFIPEALKLGLNTVQFQGIIEGQWGRFYRRTDFLADWREYSGRERKRNKLKSVPNKHRVTWATAQVTEGVQRATYNYNFNVKGYDTFLEKEVEIGVTVASEFSISMEEALEKAGEIWMKYKEEIVNPVFERESVTVKKGMGAIT